MSNKIKLLYVVSTLKQSGPTTQLFGVVKNIDKDKFNIKILTLSPEPEDSLIEDFLALGINVDSLNMGRLQFILKGSTLLKKYLREYNPHIVHSSGIRPDTVIAKIKKKFSAEYCTTIHNYAYDDYVAKYGKIIGNIAAKSNVNAIKRFQYPICCSLTLKEKYEKTTSGDMYAIQNGVNIEKFQPPIDNNSKLEIRSKLKIPKDKTVFLAVGSLIKRKDPVTIIKGFQKANVSNKGVLLLLGDGDMLDQCKETTDSNVIIKGNVSDVKSYLHASDYYISASKSEGLPYSVLEAASCGLNIILSNIPQHNEIFRNKSELVDYFEVGEVDELASIIRNVNEEHSADINLDVVDYIQVNFSDKAMGKKYEEFYFSMIKSSSKVIH